MNIQYLLHVRNGEMSALPPSRVSQDQLDWPVVLWLFYYYAVSAKRLGEERSKCGSSSILLYKVYCFIIDGKSQNKTVL